MKKEKIGYFILIATAFLSIAALFFISPMEQDSAYHHFCDSKTIFTIPNFWNVVSNLPFLVVGLIGLLKASKFPKPKVQYILFFTGVSLVSFGSGYYHWNPNNDTLVWDRLPMTIAFMSLFSIIISEFIDEKKGLKILIPAILVGLFSVIYWQVFNDLRIYGLVQFYPMLAIPVILILFRSKYNFNIGYWILFVAYLIAKIFEHFDHEIETLLNGVSGHPLKHFVSALGIFYLLYAYTKRKNSDLFIQ